MSSQQLPPTQPPRDYFLEMLIPSLVMTIAALALVAGRVYVRLRILRSFGWDDWLIVGAAGGLIAGMIITGFAAKAIEALAEMFNRLLAEAEIIDETGDAEAANKLATTIYPEIPNYNTMIQAQIIAYSVSNTLARLSILLSYRRFTPREVSPLLRKLTVVFSILTVLIGIASEVIAIAPCWPPHLLNYMQQYVAATNEAFFGAHPLPFKCLDEVLVVILGNNLGVAPDLVIFAMPFFMLQKANIRKAQRRNLYLLFAFGGVVFAAATARLIIVLYVSLGGTSSFPLNVAGFLLSGLEATAMVATACIPTLNPLFRMIKGSRPLTSISTDAEKPSLIEKRAAGVEITVMMDGAEGREAGQPSRPPRSPMYGPNDEMRDMETRVGGRPGVLAPTQSYALGLGAGTGYGPSYEDRLNLQVVNPDRSRSTTPGLSPSPTPRPNTSKALPSQPRVGAASPGRSKTPTSQSFSNKASVVLPPIPRMNSVKSLPYSRPSTARSTNSVDTGNPGGVMGGGVGFLPATEIPTFQTQTSYTNTASIPDVRVVAFPTPPSSSHNNHSASFLSPNINNNFSNNRSLTPDNRDRDERLSAISTTASAIIDTYTDRNNTPTPTPPSPGEEYPPPPPLKPKLMIPNNRSQAPRAPSPVTPPDSIYTYGFSASPSSMYAPDNTPVRLHQQNQALKAYTNGQNFHRESSSSFTLPNGQPKGDMRDRRDTKASSFFINLNKKADSPTSTNGEINTYGNGVDAYGREVVEKGIDVTGKRVGGEGYSGSKGILGSLGSPGLYGTNYNNGMVGNNNAWI